MIDDGGYAFPRPLGTGGGSYNESQKGMTLRDWFAGMALQGALASCGEFVDMSDQVINLTNNAYKIADAMIAARKK